MIIQLCLIAFNWFDVQLVRLTLSGSLNPGDVNRKFRLLNQSNSIKTNHTYWSNRLNSIKLIDQTIEVIDWTIESNWTFTCFFRLIGFDWLGLTSIDSIDQFDWVRLIRSVSLINLINQLDWFDRSVRLSSTGFTFDNRNFRLSSIKFSFSAWGLKPEW